MGNGGRPYRVVQWATGNIGTRALRAVIDHPALELVGLYVHSDSKVGLDAGELAGTSANGIKAVNDIEQVIALKPDCVLYMQQGANVPDVSRLLEAGINVVATRSEFHNPSRMDPAMRSQLEEACRKGGTSLHSTGSSPGFITEALPIVLTSLSRRLDFLGIDEYAVMTSRNSPEMIFGIMGFGESPDAFDERRVNHLREAFGPSLAIVADALGLPLESFETKAELALARNDTQIAAGLIKAGTIAGQRMTITGLHGGKPLMQFRANWFVTEDIDQDWELAPTGWRVRVQGDTPMDVSIVFPIKPEDMAATTPGYTAHRAVNAVPAVCEAEPGIRTTPELPQIIARLG